MWINAFWVAALLLAYIEFPDFSTPLKVIADAVRRMSLRVKSTPRPISD